MTPAKLPPRALRQVQAGRMVTDVSQQSWRQEDVDVVVEAPLTIDVHGVQSFTLLCTPVDTRALAAGFLFTEGVIDSVEAITMLRPCVDDPSVMRVKLRDPSALRGNEGRNLLIASSCGLCGVENLDKKLASLPLVGDDLRVDPRLLEAVRGNLHEKQVLFRACGGTHAVGIFDASAKLVSWAEDAGRHNALDKAIGHCLLERVSMAGCGVALSGRASVDMVSKCARAGIELISAISAPTSLAVDLAERCNITLCAFVRKTRATVFSHPRRLGGGLNS